MDIRPIISALLRNRTGAFLVALQIAITLAVLANAGFIVQQRLEKMGRPSGYDDANIVTLQVVGIDSGALDVGAIAADLRALRALPGVVAASVTPQLPLSGSGIGWGFAPTPEPDDPDTTGASLLLTDEAGLEAFGLRLTEGRWFHAEEVAALENFQKLTTASMASVVVSRAFADRMFPDGGALGGTVYDITTRPSTIVGVVDRAQGYFIEGDSFDRTVFWPAILGGNDSKYYVMRVAPGTAGALMQDAEQALLATDPRRIVRELRTLADVRAGSYRNDRAMTVTLLTVMGLLIVVTVLGIFGLTSFNVSRRRKQIGTRRALGARRADILRHFLVESWLVATAGALIGIALAVGLSVWLVSTFELPKLDWRYLPAGIILLWVVAQAAAFGPARRAAAVEPAIATRSV